MAQKKFEIDDEAAALIDDALRRGHWVSIHLMPGAGFCNVFTEPQRPDGMQRRIGYAPLRKSRPSLSSSLKNAIKEALDWRPKKKR